MLKHKKILLSALLALILALSAALFVGITGKSAFAETKAYYSAEEYTNSDDLLKEDGTLSDRNINIFADEVKAASNGKAFAELAQVIPLEYLESSQTNAVYHYNGAEYGFYMVKEGSYFDLLLIDFVYEFEDSSHSAGEFKIKIEPILQQSFKRVGLSGGGYTWQKYTDNSRYKYYVAQPRFLTVLQNENMRNYGDMGYSKVDDEGGIIYQMRANYGKISYATESDFNHTLADFTVNRLFGLACDMTGIVGNIASFIVDVVNLGNDLYNIGLEKTIKVENEGNIKTNMPKSMQKTNPDLAGYSRLAAFMPKEEIVLSDANDSYAELIVQLSEVEYRSRLTQMCDFDIVRRKSNFSSMEEVKGPGHDDSFSVVKERILFSDQNVQTLGGTNFEGEIIPVYLLPHGDQNIVFTPEYSGEYILSFNLGYDKIVEVEPIGKKFEDASVNVGLNLKGGTTYTFKIYHHNETIQADFEAQFYYKKVVNGDNSIYINNKNDRDTIVNLKKLPTDIYKFTAPSGLSYKILNENFEEIENSSTGIADLYVSENYYLLIHNPSTRYGNVNLNITPIGLSDAGKDYFVEGGTTGYYKFMAAKTSAYAITAVGADANFIFKYYNYAGAVREVTGQGLNTYNFSLNENDEIWIKVGGSNRTTIRFEATTQVYSFIINGQKLVGESVWLTRGSEYSIKLTAKDKEVEGVTFSTVSTSYWQCQNGKLKINANAPLSQDSSGSRIEVVCLNGDIVLNILTVFVKHNLNVKFDTYYEAEAFGTENKTQGLASGEYMSVSYTVTPDYVFNSQVKNLSAKKFNVKYYYVDNSVQYLCDLYLSVDVDYIIVNNLKIYNVNWSGYNSLPESKKIQNFNCDTLKVHTLFNGGEGSYDKPYLISNQRNLYNIRYGHKSPNDDLLYGYYKFTNSISLSGKWEPIPTAFAGTLDGNGYNLANMNIDVKDSEMNGLFRLLEYGKVLNLNFVSMTISSKEHFSDSTFVGAVAGVNSHGRIENCSLGQGSTITLENAGYIHIGGIVGFNTTFSNVISCSNFGNLLGSGNIGGIVGQNQGTIQNCDNSGTVKGYNVVGGIVGLNIKGTVNQCQNNENVYCEYKNMDLYAGGIAGVQEVGAKVTNSSNYGTIKYTGAASDNKNIQPRMAQIIGINNDGCTLSGAGNHGNVDKGTLTKVGGFIGIGKTDQAKYVNSGSIGQQL